jgi:hypothetical protein
VCRTWTILFRLAGVPMWMILLDKHKECNSIFQSIFDEDFTPAIRGAMMDGIIAHHQDGGEALSNRLLKTVLTHHLGLQDFSDAAFMKYHRKFNESVNWHQTLYHNPGSFKEHVKRIIS